MATPLAVTDRIQIKYIIQGLPHVARFYVIVDGSVGPGELLAKRGGGGGLLWTDAAQYTWEVMKSVLLSSTTSAEALAEHLDGVSWNPVDSYTCTGAGLQSVVNLAEQVTMVFRDQAFRPVKFVLLETNQGYAGHDVDGSGLSAALHNINLAFTTDVDPAAPYNWMRGRGGSLLANTGASVGVTLDSNDTLRRARGYA